MPEEEKPTKVQYRFRPAEFVRLNPLPSPLPGSASGGVTKPLAKVRGGAVENATTVGKSADGVLGSSTAPEARPIDSTDVLSLLQLNREKEETLSRVAFTANAKRRMLRRAMSYIFVMVLVNLPLGYFAYRTGHNDAWGFVFSISAIVLFSSTFSWLFWVVKI
jgi:hypothetical protein